jgi:hypothetical protein
MPYTFNPIGGNLDYYTVSTVLSGTISDHGDLTGLSNDNHLHYHTNARGDARYYTETELDIGQLDNRYYTELESDIQLAGKSDTTHNHDADYSQIEHNHDADYSQIGHNHGADYSPLVHDHDDRYYTKTEIDTVVKDITFNCPAITIANEEYIQIYRFTTNENTKIKVWSAGLSALGGGQLAGSYISIYNETDLQTEYQTNNRFISGNPITTLNLNQKDISIRAYNGTGVAVDLHGFITITQE